MVRVLLLEDNPSMLAMLAQVLEWGGYEVITGRDGLDGIEILQTADLLPAIIISDWSMPEMDGFELVHHVRSTPEWEHIPCMIMSAHSAPDDRRKALEQGADEFLEKPFNLEDFQHVLQRWEFTG